AGDANRSRARPVERDHDVQQRRLARPGGANDREQLAGVHPEADPGEGDDRRVRAVRLRHLLELEHRRSGRGGAHDAGTTTRWPAARPLPLTCTIPSASSNRPTWTATSRWTPPAPTSSTA